MQVGWVFFFIATSAVGGVIGGILCDKFFQRRFRLILVINSMLIFMILIVFSLEFPSILANPAPFSPPQWFTGVLLIAAGFFFGVSFPIFYEMGVELTYPLSPSTSSGFYTLFMNIVSLLLLLVGAYIPLTWLNVVTSFFMVICILPLMIMKEEYKRSDVDQGNKTENSPLLEGEINEVISHS